jgi:hypothetical protein
VSSAAEKTVEVSSILYEKGSETLTQVRENQKIGEITEKSKQTIGSLSE